MSALTEAEREVRRDDVDAVARILMDAWERAEGSRVGLSYIATHADMARALIASDWLAAREAAAREAVLAEVEALAREFIPPYNCELRYDGTEDLSIAAWVEDRFEVVDRLHALVARLRADA